MKSIAVMVFIGLAAACGANPLFDSNDAELMAATGGWLIKPNTQEGEIVYVNCQKAAKEEWIRESIDYFTDECTLKVTLCEGKFDIKAPAVQGNLSLFIVDDASLPMALVAPEGRWALVNVAPLKTDKVPFFRARVKKELARVFSMLCGGFKSNYNGNLTGPVVTVKDLDTQMNATLPVDVLDRFKVYLPAFGVKPGSIVTYEDACQEGWAAQPTNKYQKAIWDKVHSIPDKPMKITFDPATQKGKVTK